MDTIRRIFLTVMLVLLAGCTQKAATVAPGATPLPVGTAAPSPTPLPTGITILADGVVQAAQPALPLAFEAGGRLLAVHVQAGDQVQAGDLIATLDATNAQDQVAQAQLNLQLAELALANLTDEAAPADLAAAQANLASAKANLTTLTRPTEDQQLQAARQNLSSAQYALQDMLDLSDTDKIDIAIVEHQVEQAKNALWGAQSQRDAVCGGGSGAACDAANAAVQQSEEGVRIAELQLERSASGPRDGEIANARAQVAQAQANLDTLLKDPDPDAVAAAEAQVEQAQAALDALLAGASARDRASAEISVAQARLALESAQRQLDNTKLTAPVSGAVIAVQAAPGALVGSGSPIVTLLDITKLTFHTTNLSERDLAQISPGQPAVVTLKAYPNDPIAATVVRIGVQAGPPLGDAATFPVVLDFGETNLDIRPGMTGRVEIRREE